MSGNATNPKVDIELVPPMVTNLIIAILGCFGNLSIIIATIRSRSLHTPCHILIAINALSETGSLCGQFIFGYVILSGINSVTLEWCWYKQLVPNFFFDSCMLLTLIIGLDRVYCIVFPATYLKRNKGLYLTIVLLTPLAYSLVWIYLSYWVMSNNPNIEVNCVISDFFQGQLADIRQFEIIIIGLLMVIAYLVIWVLIKCRKNQSSDLQQRLIKSLTVITIIVLISWPITMFLYYFVALVSPWQKIRMWCMYVSILMNLGMSLNYVVYFLFSTEHRAAFKKQLRCLLCIPYIREMAKKMSANNVATVNVQIRHKLSVTTTQRSSER